VINAIVVVDKDMGIGCNNNLLARIKPDMEHFKRTTMGHVVVMGYKTYKTIPKFPLEDRVNIVLTSKDIELEGAIVVHSIEELMLKLNEYKGDKEIFNIGGGQVFKQLMPYTDKLYVTHVFESFEADTFFPEIGEGWEVESVTANKENLFHKHPHVFVVYKRV